MEEFLRSHVGTFALILVGAVPFYIAVRGSLLREWHPTLAALGGAALAFWTWAAWGVGNQAAAFILAVLLFNALLVMFVGWLRHKSRSEG